MRVHGLHTLLARGLPSSGGFTGTKVVGSFPRDNIVLKLAN